MELWNEAGHMGLLESNSEEFAKFVKIGSKAVHEEDPTAKQLFLGVWLITSFYQDNSSAIME